MDQKKLEFFKERLLKEKARLEKDIKEIEIGIVDNTQSEFSGENSYEDNFADIGTATFERERDLSLERNTKDILGRVNQALEKMNKGTYGVCAHCGDEIDPARLKALPYVDLCIKCKKKEEAESW